MGGAAVCAVNTLLELAALHSYLVYGNDHRLESLDIGKEIIAQQHYITFLSYY